MTDELKAFREKLVLLRAAGVAISDHSTDASAEGHALAELASEMLDELAGMELRARDEAARRAGFTLGEADDYAGLLTSGPTDPTEIN